MNNLIRLTHDDIKRMVNESVHALLKEGFGPSTYFTLSDDFANMANELKEKAWQLEGFVNEFPKFVKTMQQLTQKFGLVLKNASTDDYYDMDNVVEMLLKSTSEQLQDFRGILFAIYRHAGKGEFDEKDIETMKQLLAKVEKKYDGENPWDKIQLMQIKWLKSNLKGFIEQMS